MLMTHAAANQLIAQQNTDFFNVVSIFSTMGSVSVGSLLLCKSHCPVCSRSLASITLSGEENILRAATL